MTQVPPVDHHCTVDIYIAGRSDCRVRVNRIPTADAHMAISIARRVLDEVAKHSSEPHALRMELIEVTPIHEATIKG
ncbi:MULTISPECIES: hypothetical protein [Achromobacter]|uniref:Uncharacterized protein n=1 Tax=Achromobacter denitrificans TaxID=32002 RepID=A0ABZ3G1E2_ACHDE|nr:MULTISPECIES: hypothetical protein [Achromobacter]